MCLITNKKPQIATEDIVVYKLLTAKLKAPFTYFQYVLDHLYQTELTTTIDPEDIRCFCSVDQRYLENHFEDWTNDCEEGILTVYQKGFHSISSVELAQRCDLGVVLFKCIIPKGSIYVEDFVGFIVSNQMIIKEMLDDVD